MKELDVAQILRHLEEDMGELLSILAKPDVYEVMLNPYLKEDGMYEGHLWYEEYGIGMARLTKSSKTVLDWPIIKLGDTLVYKHAGEAILSYSLLTSAKDISLVLKHELQDNTLIQSTHYKLCLLADKVASNNEDLPELVAKLNAELNQLIGIDFRLAITQLSNDNLAMFSHKPECLISKQFVKMTESKAEQIMSILSAANSMHFHAKSPRLECAIPFYHHRFTGQRAPIVKFPSFAIRKHSSKVITLDEYVAMGILPLHCMHTIKEWIRRGNNILVCGGTGSGKTTLLNAIIHETAVIHPNLRAVIIEDTPEIQCAIENSVALVKSNEVSIDNLLTTTLRMRPDSIIVGEVRSKEAYTLFKAMLTGHRNCYGTIHANGAYEATFRFEQCVKEHPDCAMIPVPKHQIALALNCIVSIQKATIRVERNGHYENIIKRKITALREITGYDVSHDIYEDVMLYQDKEAIIEEA